ncbi:MAG: exo-alpha-sialidase [Thermoplasmata archaeon]|nr:exo-alpha-sialidase [Thermoplasmata archaeon]
MNRTLSASVVFILLATLFAVLPPGVSAAGNTFSDSILVNWNNTINHQRRPILLTRGTDELYVVYQDYGHTNWNILIANSSDGGFTWGTPLRVDDSWKDDNESNDFSNQMYPAAAFAPNGTLYVAYTDDQEVLVGAHYNHIYVVWSDDCRNFSRHIRVDTSIRHAEKPSLAIGNDGTLYLAWLDKRVGGKYHVYFARSEDGGVTWIGEKRVNTGGLDVDQYDARIAVYGEKVFVVWADQRGGDFNIYMAVSYNRGDSFEEERRVNDDIEPYSQTGPVLTVDPTGLVYIFWSDKRLGSYDIYYSTTRDGKNFTVNQQAFGGPEGSNQLYVHAATYGPGQVGIVWVDMRHDEGDIYFTYTINNGTTWIGAKRVDDTGRNLGTADDETKQEDPYLAFNSIGRPMVVWSDHRDELFTRSDIFFSRYSETLSGTNRPPYIRDLGFSPEIGTNATVFTFKMWYRDLDNDDPEPGYPKVRFYADENGTSPIGYAVLSPLEEERDNIEGSLWEASATIEGEGGRIYYQYEVISGDMSEPITSSIMPGPILDLAKPVVLDYGPQTPKWHNTSIVRCFLMVKDVGVAGINPSSIRAYIKTLGSDVYTGVGDKPTINILPNGSVYAYLDVPINDGKYNWVKWRFADRVGNTAESPAVNLWADTIQVKFGGLKPDPRRTQIFPVINVSITVYDRDPYQPDVEVSGVNISSIQYCYRHSEVLPYSDWIPVGNYSVNEYGDVRVWFDFRLTEGNLNMIKFRAKDNADTGWYIYGPVNYNLRIPDNYPPTLTGSIYPRTTASRTPHIWWDPAEDLENDTITYKVRIIESAFGTTKMDWTTTGRYNFIDVPEEVHLQPGKYIVEVVANDSHSDSNVLKGNLTILSSGNLPPSTPGPLSRDIYTYTLQNISWGSSSDPEGDAITYMLQIGRDWGVGDILPWTWVSSTEYRLKTPLTYGIYHIEILAWDGGNFSPLRKEVAKVVDFGINFSAKGRWSVERGDALMVEITIENLAHMRDNVTVYLEAGGAEGDWITIETLYKEYSLDLNAGVKYPLRILIMPKKSTELGTYKFRLRVVCEDGETTFISPEYSVKIYEKKRAKYPAFVYIKEKIFGQYLPITIFVMIAVTILGALLYNRRLKKRMVEDPFAEQRKLYKELYGVEPDLKTLKRMAEGETPAPPAVPITPEEAIAGSREEEESGVEVPEEELKAFMRGEEEGGEEPALTEEETIETPEEPISQEEFEFKKPEEAGKRRRKYVVWDEDDEP